MEWKSRTSVRASGAGKRPARQLRWQRTAAATAAAGRQAGAAANPELQSFHKCFLTVMNSFFILRSASCSLLDWPRLERKESISSTKMTLGDSLWARPKSALRG